jgi:hypothetical protein
VLLRGPALWLLALVSGCAEVFDLEVVALRDAGTGGNGDAGDGGIACYGSYASGGFLTICPQGTEVLDPWVADTVLDTAGVEMDCEIQIQTAEGELCIIVAESIAISGSVDTRGTSPLVLLATKDITIDGILHADSAGVTRGAGFDPLSCDKTTIHGTSGNGVNPGGAGGAGGSFGTRGAAGGDGDGMHAAGTPAAAASQVSALRGGCSGGNGGQAIDGQGTKPTGGWGGGAIYLLAGDRITINGVVNASGGGGEAATLQAGGGGGGAGGMIVLDAPHVVLNGAGLIAHGGGGGGGACSTTNGMRGQGAIPPSYTTTGGTGGSGGGGTGGNGATFGNALAQIGQGGSASCGGGGGGGGHGIIRIASPDVMNLSATISPPPQP